MLTLVNVNTPSGKLENDTWNMEETPCVVPKAAEEIGLEHASKPLPAIGANRKGEFPAEDAYHHC